MTDATVTTADYQIEFSASAAVRATSHGALLDRLAQARRHIAVGAENIARLQEIIGQLDHGGHDSSVAKELLVRFEGLQELHVADRDRLEKELNQK